MSFNSQPTIRAAHGTAHGTAPCAVRIAVLSACALLLAASCSSRLPTISLVIETSAGAKIAALEAEVAITDKEQQKGYMERKTIPDGTAMIFAYASDRQLEFWMKNTPHPLSIAYIDSSGVIREIYDMKSFSLKTVSSERSLRYALEVPQGWFVRAGVSFGDRLDRASLDALEAMLAKSRKAKSRTSM